jgi:predicted secreted protein
MAEIHGSLGGVYSPKAFIRSRTISFDTADNSINDSASGLVTAGFDYNMKIVVAGSASNDGSWTLAPTGIAAGKMVVTTDNTTESAGAHVMIATAAPGTLQVGFFNWTLNNSSDMHEVTDFSDGGWKTFIAGLKQWTGSADRNFHDDSFIEWNGTIRLIRFYLKYVAIPTALNPSIYFQGAAITNTTGTDAGDEVVKQALTFQGVGALTPVTRTTAWD